MFQFKHHLFCLLALLAGASMAAAADTAPWLRAWIDGEEITGTTLESRYSTLDDEPASPVIRWEKSDSRNGKPVLSSRERTRNPTR